MKVLLVILISYLVSLLLSGGPVAEYTGREEQDGVEVGLRMLFVFPACLAAGFVAMWLFNF